MAKFQLFSNAPLERGTMTAAAAARAATRSLLTSFAGNLTPLPFLPAGVAAHYGEVTLAATFTAMGAGLAFGYWWMAFVIFHGPFRLTVPTLQILKTQPAVRTTIT